MPDVQNVALGNHPIQIPSGNYTNYLTPPDCCHYLLRGRVPGHPEAVHQGSHQDTAQGPPAVVGSLLQVLGQG